MVFQLIINTLNYKKMISKIQNISFLFIILFPFTGNSQITFDKSKKELIRACELGNLKTFIREISVDSLLVVLSLSLFLWTGPTGNFETAINPNQIEKCLTQKYIDRAIQRHAEKKKSKDR